MKNSALHMWSIPIIILIGLIVFLPTIDIPFYMDDEVQILGNIHIQNLANWKSFFTASTFDGGGGAKMSGIYYKPLMTSFYALTWHFFGANPVAFRVPMLMAHITSSILVFTFLKRFFPIIGALFAGLVFLLHPINSEVVAYIADAQDTLYMLFGLGALLACTSVKSRSLRLGLVIVLLVCSLLSKETGALFLLILPLYCVLFEKNKSKDTIILALVLLLSYLVLRSSLGLMNFNHSALLIHQASWSTRLLTVPALLWHYIEVFFFPWRIQVMTDFVVSEATLEDFWLPLSGVVVFLGSLIFFVKKSGSKIAMFGFGLLIFWGGLHSNIIIPLDSTYAERWFYLGSLGAIILVVEATRRWQKAGVQFWAPAMIVVVTLGVRTSLHLKEWKDPLALYQKEVELKPWDWFMANNLGVELFRAGRILDARPHFKRSTEINPMWDIAWNNLGAVEQRLGHYQEAFNHYKKSTELGTYFLAYENYASLLCATASLEECKSYLQYALSIFPNNQRLLELASKIDIKR